MVVTIENNYVLQFARKEKKKGSAGFLYVA